MNLVFDLRQRARTDASRAMMVWSFVMAVILTASIVTPSAGLTTLGFVVSAIFGATLGWRRRMGIIVVAPFASWAVAWFPMEIASMVHWGVLKGFFDGLLLITVGWIAIGLIEMVWIFMVASLVRSLRRHPKEPSVVVIDPTRN